MKIAILYSGLYRKWDGWMQNHLSNLPKGDIYLSTWESERPKVDVDRMRYFPDPKPTYNCYQVPEFMEVHGEHLQHKGSEIPRLKTGYFQHLAHWLLLDSIKKNYDIIIRMRYDTFLGNTDKLMELCEQCNRDGASIGIGNTNRKDDENKLMAFQPLLPFRASKPFLLDFMTIHKPEACLNVCSLVEQERMMPTNAGWHQILGMNGFRNYRGAIQLKRYMP